MTEKKKPIVENVAFPDFMASDSTKIQPEFGRQVGQAIKRAWFFRPEGNGMGTQCKYYDRRTKYHELRMYARGEQDSAIYKNLLTDGESESFTNYDFRPIKILPKFVKTVVNQMSERFFEVKADAVDKYSTDMKNSYRQYLEDLRVSKDLIQDAKKTLGVDIMPTGVTEIPDSQEEIDLHMSMKYKPAIEIATEESVKYTLGLNKFDEAQSRIIEDITVIGIGAAKHITDPNKGIVTKHLDPADMVYAYPKERDFESVHYYGELERMTVMELKRLSGESFSADELKEMTNSSAMWAGYHGTTNQQGNNITDNTLDGVLVDVMHFTFKALNTITYIKREHNGGFSLDKKDDTYGDEGEGTLIKKTIDVWYEGSLVLCNDKLFNYRLCENMIRPEGLLNKTVPNYVMFAPDMYQNSTQSLVGLVVPTIDLLQQVHIKMQQAIAKARPSGIYIDTAGINEVALGDGNFLNPLELIKIFDETGNVLGSSVNADGDYNYGKVPITELRNGINGINEYIISWNKYMNDLRDAIGIPVGADASTPHPDMAVGVQQQLANNSNTATRHILNGTLNITQRIAEGVIYRLRDIFKYSELREVYINAIGRLNVDILESMKNYHLHDLGVLISLKPDAQDKQNLELLVTTALGKGEITLTDAIDIRDIGNIKYAKELLKIRRDKREKDAREFEMQKIQANAQAQQQSNAQASQFKLAELQAKAQSEIAVEEAKNKNALSVLQAEAALKSQLMEKEFQYNMQLKGMEVQGKETMLDKQHQNKVALQNRGKTLDSKMIEQRHFNPASQNFESSEDTLSGSMDMAEIGV